MQCKYLCFCFCIYFVLFFTRYHSVNQSKLLSYNYILIGLYNGALGTVLRFLFTDQIPPNDVQPPLASVRGRPLPIVLVQLDEPLGYSCVPNVPNVVPIIPETYELTNTVSRRQLPLILAHACTIHSVQGLTAEHGITLLPPSKYNAQGLMYVACSRPRTMEQLWLLGPLYKKHFEFGSDTYDVIAEEYERLERIRNVSL